jgi:acetolactate synthase-1/2/3 large subunit
MIRVADYIAKKIESTGTKHVFMICGGGAMHLNDAISRTSMQFVCNHHEQASAIAAEGYARTKNGLGVVIVTSGPGGTNTLTGVNGQWLDSVPVLYISGQVKFETCIESCPDVGLRQLGDQETNIVDIVRPVTKYATMLTEPKDVRKEFEKAIHIATTGRPGPVWIDVPLNVQGALVDEESLEPFRNFEGPTWFVGGELDHKVSEVIDALKSAERPVFVAGHGIRIAGSKKTFLELAEKLGIPIVTTFNGFDLIPSKHPLFIGRIGTIGDRAGNFAIQNADLLLSVGTRNNLRQVSYFWQAYARAAKKVIVDIDKAELNKPTLKPDIAVHSDAGDFLRMMQKQANLEKLPEWASWTEWCRQRKERYPTVLPEYWQVKDKVHPYPFIKTLTDQVESDTVVVAGNGTACVAMFQAGIVKENQRIFWNSGGASMGYDLPAAIGACFASGKEVVCLAGDGSLQMNIQELQTTVYHKLPLKIFVLNNWGYISIRQTQDSFFGGHHVGCDETCGVSFPEFEKVAAAYGLQTMKLDSHEDMEEKIKQVLDCDGPFLCEVMLIPDYKFSPKLSSEKKPDGRIVSKPLEDMFPFLDREEFRRNMIIPVMDEQNRL